MARAGGQYTSLELVLEELLARRLAVKAYFVMAFEIDGYRIQFPGRYGKAPDMAKRELGNHFFAMFQRLLDGHRVNPHPKQRLRDGFVGVLQGLQLLHSGSVLGRS